MQPPAGDSSVVFRARGLTKVYDEGDIQVQALRGIDLELRSAELVVLLGLSGSGKSTLVKMFSVRFEGDQVTLRSTTAQRGSGDTITFIFSGTVPAIPSRARSTWVNT